MALEFITKVLKKETTPTKKLLLIILANYSDEFGESYPSHATLSRLSGLNRSTVIRNLSALKKDGLLEWKGRNSTSNLYKLLVNQGGGTVPQGGGTERHNTKANTKDVLILDLIRINEIFKEVTDKTFFVHSKNSFKADPSWKRLKELARKKTGIVSPKTGRKIQLQTEEFWYKYFEVANSEGHKKWIRSFWDKKPQLATMLGINQFDSIIERRYG
ncbi:helix-turn-helix domain-containing protein [Gammaproteobacteria bacterium]|nr:helix-turn-helix domain-containing protein [Gammaproteobacteria bacterium]